VTDGGQTEPRVDYETILETLAEGVVVVTDGTVEYCNAGAERLFGIDRSRYVGADLASLDDDVLRSADCASLRAAVDAVAAGDRETESLEARVTAADGVETVECRIERLPAGAGDGTLVVLRDLTDRRRTERELREHRDTIERLHESTATIVGSRSEAELFDLAIEAAREVLAFDVCVIAVVDGDDLVVVAATDGDRAPDPGTRVPTGTNLAGRTVERGESALVSDVHEDDRASPYDDHYRSALSIPIGEYGVFQAISTEPERYDRTDLRLAELLVRHVAETVERIRAEGRLRERETDLREERDRFAALFENVPDAIAAFTFEDGEPIVRTVNERFEETFGWSADEIVGENVDEYVVPADRNERADQLNEALLAGERLQTTGRRRTADGIRDFLLHVVPLSAGERTREGYAIYTDITEQKRRERELERQNERLDEFASIVSHDLRNPLNVAQGNLEMARETGDEEYFDLVAEAQDRMSRMIDELLSLARHGDVIGERRPVAVDDLARRAWTAVATEDATLTVTGEFVVVADEERLTELFENLFRNSVEHGSTGSGTASDDAVQHAADGVSVTVGAVGRAGESDADGGETDVDGFYVADDGPGIPPDERDQVFESGYTTADHGTGFGLTIVEQIADAHDWAVDVAAGDEGGARFEFRVDGPVDP